MSAPANRVASQQYCYIMGGTDIALYPGMGGGGGGRHKGWGADAHYVHWVLINGELAQSPVRDALKVPCIVWKMMRHLLAT